MPKRVYGLKHATPRMKRVHMNMVAEWRTNLKDSQAKYAGNGICPRCHQPIGNRPLFMVGKYDICFGCYEEQEKTK